MIASLYLAVLLLTSLPAFQSWGANAAARMLAKKTGSKVSIGNLRLNVLGRVVLDNVKLYDQRDTLMLQASRIAAKIDLIPFIEKKIRISGAQLIGAKVKLYKDGDAPLNCQFLVDAFSSKDTTSTPLDLKLGALVVRRGEVRFDYLDEPATPGRFNPKHLHIKDLSLTARVMAQMPDTLAIDLRNFSCREQSGLTLQKLSFEAKAGQKGASIRDFLLELPNSSVSAEGIIRNSLLTLKEAEGTVQLTGSVCPRDMASLVPKFGNFGDAVILGSEVQWSLPKSQCSMSGLRVSDEGGNLSLLCDATVTGIKEGPTISADIRELRTGPEIQQFVTKNLQGQAKEISPILTRLGSTKSSGTVSYQSHSLRTNLRTESEHGNVSAEATLLNMSEVSADISATNLRLGHLLNLSDEVRGTTVSLDANITGSLPQKDKLAKLTMTGLLSSLIYRGYDHRNIPFTAAIDGDTYGGKIILDEPNGQVKMQVETAMLQGKRSLQCQAKVKNFAPNKMGLTKSYEGERFSGNIDADFSDIDLSSLKGELRLTDLTIASEEDGTIRAGDVVLNSNTTGNSMHLRLKSDFLEVLADGDFNWKTLPASFMLPVKQNLPSLFQAGSSHPEPYMAKETGIGEKGNDFKFFVQVQDTLLAERLFDSDLRLPEKSILEGTISDAVGQIALQLHAPSLQMAGQQFRNVDCRAEAGSNSLQTSLQCERIMKGEPVELNLDAYATGDKVTSRLRWDNKRDVAHQGDISLTGLIRRDPNNQTTIDAKINASRIVIGDSLWHIKPATIKYHDKMVDIENLYISQAKRHINIGGRISDLSTDTLSVELADIDISYIMDLVNFHKVDFDGRATGSIYAISFMKKPFADAFLQVKDFTFNSANLGDMDLYANWGKQERAILLETDTKGPMPLHRTQIHGTIIPGKGKDDGLNLNIETSHIDLTFLTKYTKSIFSNLEGRASGWTRVFGPFKDVNLEGNMYLDEMKMRVTALGTDYHLAGDSVIMRADNIWVRGDLYDDMGSPGMSEHKGTLNAHISHDALRDFGFHIGVDASNMLCYNHPQQGSMNFFGTAYANAEVELNGTESSVEIDVKATPMPGTVLNYNTQTTGAVDETEFVTYSPTPTSLREGRLLGVNNNSIDMKDDGNPDSSLLTHLPSDQALAERSSLPEGNDIRINFDIEATPNAQIRLLMDPATGDNVSLYGDGRLHMDYYNKGHVQIYGTYRVSEGNYRMSIRDVIRKDFTFELGGTIAFGGDPMQAALNLTAKHTVPNVSLDDLSPSGLGLSNTRVDCIMNIGGLSREPVVSFDFDIPNASEDEKQMVRSMLSSEEERDMQAIYLLGVGRFYTYGTLVDTRQTKGAMAMNSVLSSVLSSRFNQIMSQALGGSGWTFGTNLRTGEEGWQHLDVEGMLSGKMLSGRLQFNGNFGYRENKYNMSGTGFIGDFDLQYRLSPRSPFSLKAYSQTNDRYFTQSSLTTQGIGIKFQRDFTHWLELFRHREGKKKEDNGTKIKE